MATASRAKQAEAPPPAAAPGRKGRRISLAWCNLTHDKRRLVVALAGVGFAVLLMFMQTGIEHALFDSTVQVLRLLRTDLVLTHSGRETLLMPQGFSRRHLVQALSVPGVESATPIYIETQLSTWKDPALGTAKPIRAIGFEPADGVWLSPEFERQRDKLAAPDSALFDAASKPEYGDWRSGETELAGRRVDVVGQFQLGTDFANDGNVFLSAANFNRYFAGARGEADRLADVDLGLVRLEPNADVQAVRKALASVLPTEVRIDTKQDYIDHEIDFWHASTPIGYVFGFGTVMGFIVGVVFCYQILYSDVADHLSEFATLKAMGYGPKYLVGVVFQEALILSVLGFLPGLVFSTLLFIWLGSLTGLLLKMTLARAVLILGLTVAMCVVSGALTVRKVLTADPAELF